MARKKSDIKVESQIEKEIDTPLPAYFLSLTVADIRCFGPEQTLDLSNGKGRPARWTIILGDNGVGKTTLLQSLVALLPIVDSRELLPEYRLKKNGCTKVCLGLSPSFRVEATPPQ